MKTAAAGDTDAVRKLLKQGAHVDARYQGGDTALSAAADQGQSATADFLLSQGADPAAAGLTGPRALVDAALTRNPQKVALVLRLGSNAASREEALFAVCESEPVPFDSPTPIGVTPSASAGLPAKSVPASSVDSGAETVHLLLEHGVNLEARHETGSTPLIWAAKFGATGVVDLLLRRGAKVEARDNDGSTALIAAACNCAEVTMPSTKGALKLLLEHGADVNATDQHRLTALMSASAWGRSGNVKLLLEHGANVRLRDARGATALSLAQKSDDAETVRLIRQALAQAVPGR